MNSYQLTIPAKNKAGVLAEVTAILSRAKINIRATTISSFGDSGFLNFIVDDPEEGQKVLEKKGVQVALKEVIAVLIKDQPGGMDSLVQLLASEKINIENAYGFVLESRKSAVFILDVESRDKAVVLLHQAGFETLDSQALSEIEPFHYMKY